MAVAEEKPVGTVWFAWAVRDGRGAKIETVRAAFQGDRDLVRELTVAHALQGVRERIAMVNKRLFFALWPDDRQREQLRDVINSVAKTVEGRPVDRGNWHVTLAFIGDFPEERVPDLA